jgi:hypothetical protein
MQSARRKLPRSKTSGINGLRHYSFRPRRETPHNRALRIIALCRASHKAEFEAAMIRERTRADLARLGRRESVLAAAN